MFKVELGVIYCSRCKSGYKARAVEMTREPIQKEVEEIKGIAQKHVDKNCPICLKRH